MQNKKILILYACSGSLGHKVLAQNYHDLLNHDNYVITIKDVYELDKKKQIDFGNHLYFWGLKRLPYLWRWLYFHWQLIPFSNWFKTTFLPSYFKETINFIKEFNPDIVITIHPTATSIISYLKSKKEISTKLITAFSDWHIQTFWLFPEVDKYLVVTKEQKIELVKTNIPKKNIEVTGILLGKEYYQVKCKSEARKLLGVAKDSFVILVMGGGEGWGIEMALKQLTAIEKKFCVIVIGANKRRQSEIKHWLSSNIKIKNKAQIYGFIEPSLHFAASDLIISKPGGLTTSQAFLLKLPFLVNSPQPGHEEENLKALKKFNAVISTKDKHFRETLEFLVENKNKLLQVSEDAYNLAPIKTPSLITKAIRYELQD